MTGVASAASAPAATLACGTTITHNTTLRADVGPCGATDGLVVKAPNITLNLNGFTVTGQRYPGDQVGIRLVNVTGVTVRNGTVQGFDAGVAIVGGSANTVTNMTAKNNVNDLMGGTCDSGDGISMTNSNKNVVTSNHVIGNGPFGGISLVEKSHRNLIKGNYVVGNNIPGANNCGNGGYKGNEDEGIRIEGPGAAYNHIESNHVTDSSLFGIGLHPNLGCTNPPDPNSPLANNHNFIIANTVTASFQNGTADGIGMIGSGPLGNVTCAASDTTIIGNNVSNNERDGIRIIATSVGNIIASNTVNRNGGVGIQLNGPLTNDAFTNNGGELLDVTSPNEAPFVPGTDFVVLPGSATGNVTAPLVPVGVINVTPPIPFDSATSGCSRRDFLGFPKGAVALIQRGFCDGFGDKVGNAVAAGASAVILFNEGSTGRTGLPTDIPGATTATTVPVVGTTFAAGQQLFNLTQSGPVTVHVVTNTTNVVTPVNVGAVQNTLMNNVGFDNVEYDANDANPHCGSNQWTSNQFGIINRACIKAGGGTGTVIP
jgi:parallel beta-helix repeat protein